LISIASYSTGVKAKIGDPSPRLHKTLVNVMGAGHEDCYDGTVIYDLLSSYDSRALQVCIEHVNFIES